ncbi:MAG: SDR family oxidoreductase [Planctomycetes bacterium]|nr:SDR family oxidoreductase [Planctomycetota bacterium]
MSGFKDKVVLVTGAASGIGLATARAFAAAGARVLVTDLDGDAAARAAADLPGAVGLALDVTSERAWAEATEAAGERLDVLVNNAGVAAGAPLAEQDLAAWRRLMAVNLDGVMLGLRAATPPLRRARGNVVNVASASGRKAQAGAAAYCVSKAALLMLSRVAALEFAPHGVRVNCVVPGGVETPMWARQPFFADLVAEKGSPAAAYAALASETPLGRFCRPEEVAAAVLALAGDQAGFVTGAELAVDGGYGLT